jgi:hypothetical protein
LVLGCTSWRLAPRIVGLAEFDGYRFRISARRTFKGPLVVIDLFGRFDVREKHLLCACREWFFLSC